MAHGPSRNSPSESTEPPLSPGRRRVQSAARSAVCGFPAHLLYCKPAFKTTGDSGCSTPATSTAGAESQRTGILRTSAGASLFNGWKRRSAGLAKRRAHEEQARPAHDALKHARERRPRGHGDLRSLRAPSRRQRRRAARDRDGPEGRAAPSVQQLRRKDDIDPARLAHGPTPGRPRPSTA
jgi:hypothetical protein